MFQRPCPICKKPVFWETTPSRPFCSERCKIRDLGNWSAEAYRVEANSGSEEDDSWSEPPQTPEGT